MVKRKLEKKYIKWKEKGLGRQKDLSATGPSEGKFSEWKWSTQSGSYFVLRRLR